MGRSVGAGRTRCELSVEGEPIHIGSAATVPIATVSTRSKRLAVRSPHGSAWSRTSSRRPPSGVSGDGSATAGISSLLPAGSGGRSSPPSCGGRRVSRERDRLPERRGLPASSALGNRRRGACSGSPARRREAAAARGDHTSTADSCDTRLSPGGIRRPLFGGERDGHGLLPARRTRHPAPLFPSLMIDGRWSFGVWWRSRQSRVTVEARVQPQAVVVGPPALASFASLVPAASP